MASSSAMAPTAPEFWCKICKLPFTTDGAFKIHKVNSDRHICCDVCGADFKSEEGRKRHRAAHHAEEQDLTCKFCGLNYPRVGSLINHYEESQCKQVSKEVFKQAIKDIMARDTAKRKAHNFVDIRRSGDSSGQEPLPPLRNASNSSPAFMTNDGIENGRYAGNATQGSGSRLSSGSNAAYQDSGWQAAGDSEATSMQQGDWSGTNPQRTSLTGATGFESNNPLISVIPDFPIREDEDLISFDVSEVLNSPWSVPASEALKNVQRYNRAKDFPALGGNAVNQKPGENISRGLVQDITQGVTQAPVNRGVPQTWITGANANATTNSGGGGQRVVPESSNHGHPHHTWGNAGSSLAEFVNQEVVNQKGQAFGQNNTQNVMSGGGSQDSTGRGPPHTWGRSNTTSFSTTQATLASTNRDLPNNSNFNGYRSEIWNNSGNESIKGNSAAASNSQPGGPVQNPWGKKNLFPDAPAAVAPPADLLSSLNINTGPSLSKKVYRMFDPVDPAFKASKFYVQIIGRWKCPHKGCK
ncbi:hypothetical protein ONS95_008764 [Cadophora gregata]|uniref:uncharacterized protein n=1 Tax=Cadophora gregata TaxID=51156 RepID=UPI0026DD6CCD|nr:uncharacterized protein ONS95_008764 [Cadophora gregata]KAK0123757.1 hypothetical protein ONS95_008764 [Cadophora gregata]